MSASNPRTPSYRRQMRSCGTDLAFVELGGTRHYLGAYGSPESRELYHRLLAEWSVSGHTANVQPEVLTILELCARYMQHAETYYAPPSRESKNFVAPIRALVKLYGRELVSNFGPRALKAVRESFVEAGLARTHINMQINRLKRVFKWGVAEELVPASVFHSLQAVEGLKRGRTQAQERERVKPVSETHIEAIHQYVAPQVWAMIQLQLLTAARSGEVLIMRLCDIDRSGDVWVYKPLQHKTAYHGHERNIYLGRRAQEVLLPFLEGKAPTDFLFSPSEAEQARRAKRHAARKTPLSCGNVPNPDANPERLRIPGTHYQLNSYRRAIARACKQAGIPHWHPHQLRHNAATRFRHEFGLEAAQVLLGHRRADVTQIYAETNHAKAIQIAERIG